MLKPNKIILYIAIMCFSIPSFAQSKKALQEKKEQLEKAIEYTNKLLGKTKKNRIITLF